MRQLPWGILLALLAGFGLGLAYSWVISPLRVVDAAPVALRADFKDSYRAVIASAYAANGNLPRAEARLSLLKDSHPIEALNAQAQRLSANGDAFQQADQVAALALALDKGVAANSPTAIPATKAVSNINLTSTATFPPPPPEIPIILTGTQLPITLEAQPTLPASTPRPTQTAIATPGAPFRLNGQEKVCDTNLPEGLLQVMVLSSSRRQMSGVKIVVTWDGGEEQFFTGLKPELGNGYADYIMTANVTYTVQLAVGSDVATGVSAPSCLTSSGETFTGGIKLTFQQP
jgi:hypothetical protein